MQHDVAEFLTHILPRLEFDGFLSAWQGRVIRDGELRITDDMRPTSPVLLSWNQAFPNSRQMRLPTLIQAWSDQTSRYGLTDTAPVILQLPRYRVFLNGNVRKRPFQVPLISRHDRAFTMPVFSDPAGVVTHPHPFEVIAAVLHYGNSTSSGHYRAMLFPRSEGRPWLTEDGICATQASPSDLTDLASNCYLLFAKPADSEA